MVFTYCNLKRYYYKHENIKILILDFDNFMNFPPFYNHLQDYIKKNQIYDLKYLDFWINYHRLDNIIYSRNKLEEKLRPYKNENLLFDQNHDSAHISKLREIKPNFNVLEKRLEDKIKRIKEKINQMHDKYYGTNESDYNNDKNNICDKKIIDSLQEFKIDFPIDIQEKVEECILLNTDHDNINDIFEESYNFICYHLSNIHSDIIIKDKEFLERILYIMNYFEINDD
jgi:hypothetical protein